MKIFFFSTFFLTFCLQGICQHQNYKITYRHNLQFDTLKTLKDTIGKEAILIGNSDESNYSFAKAVARITPLPKNNGKTLEELVKAKQSGTAIGKIDGAVYDSMGNIVYQNRRSKSLFVREKMIKEYVVTEETIPIINWIIKEEIRIIKNYACKKAIAHFRGRDYTAWFTTDVPIVAAPWKFAGLPGLLMDIEDSRHQVKIYVEKIEYPTLAKVPGFANSGTKISLEKYFTFKNEEYKKILKGMEIAQMQQDHIQEIIANGGKKPTVTSTSTLYGIEIRLD